MKMLTVNDAINALRTSKDYEEFTFKLLREVKLVDAIPIPDNATNGDMIKFMFPSIKSIPVALDGKLMGYDIPNLDMGSRAETYFTASWWNAPYKGDK